MVSTAQIDSSSAAVPRCSMKKYLRKINTCHKKSSFTAPSEQEKVKITMNPIHHIFEFYKQKENKTLYSLLWKKKEKTNNKIM
jgi:hypothetical protein